jgi:hypothetical protein
MTLALAILLAVTVPVFAAPADGWHQSTDWASGGYEYNDGATSIRVWVSAIDLTDRRSGRPTTESVVDLSVLIVDLGTGAVLFAGEAQQALAPSDFVLDNRLDSCSVGPVEMTVASYEGDVSRTFTVTADWTGIGETSRSRWMMRSADETFRDLYIMSGFYRQALMELTLTEGGTTLVNATSQDAALERDLANARYKFSGGLY